MNHSHHAVLGIGDAPVEAAPAGLAVEAHGEIAEGVGGVRGPVVHRVRAQHRVLVVVLGAVEGERIDAARAFAGVEPGARDHHAHRVDAILDAVHGRERDAESRDPAGSTPLPAHGEVSG